MRRMGEGCALVVYGARAEKSTCAVSVLGSALDGPLSHYKTGVPERTQALLYCTDCAAVGKGKHKKKRRALGMRNWGRGYNGVRLFCVLGELFGWLPEDGRVRHLHYF